MDDFILDTDREKRLGFPEVIFGNSKSADLLRRILNEYHSKGENSLATRVQPDKGQAVKESFPDAHYDSVSQSFLLQYRELDDENAPIAILSAGSSDLSAVNEAYFTLNLLGTPAKRVNDVGVAGIHRLFNRLDDLKACRVLIGAQEAPSTLPKTTFVWY